MSTTTPTVICNPRQRVQQAAIEELVAAYAAGLRHPFAVVYDDDGAMRFMCPKCNRCNHNGGTAHVVDAFRWKCSWCRRTMTRFLLERTVLEDADMVEALFDGAS